MSQAFHAQVKVAPLIGRPYYCFLSNRPHVYPQCYYCVSAAKFCEFLGVIFMALKRIWSRKNVVGLLPYNVEWRIIISAMMELYGFSVITNSYAN